ncbi:MAG: DsbA family oxidoreductase [Nitrospirae bacterium]|nr:DsbA family oxidoreductase [Nitrospirota bacterium]MBI3594716.1 DsbA family oxidoreductase [Nitrospirota bacterium]
MTITGKKSLNVDIVSDLVCPWCFIGKRHLEKALTLVSTSSELKLSWKPFELNPHLPQGGVNYHEYLSNKFGDEEEFQNVQHRVQEAAGSIGLHLEFDRIERLPNTFDAHRLVWFSNRTGRQNQLVEALFRAVFLEGKFIGDHHTLVEIAITAGLDPAEVRPFLDSSQGKDEVQVEKALSHNRGVLGVPNILINGRYVVRGAQPPEFIARFLEKALHDSTEPF